MNSTCFDLTPTGGRTAIDLTGFSKSPAQRPNHPTWPSHAGPGSPASSRVTVACSKPYGRSSAWEQFTALPIPQSQADELRRVADRHGVEDVRVYGSVARGESTPRSDVDLLIRLRPGHGFSDFMAFCEEAERVLGRRVDVVTEDGLSPYIRDRVLAEAVSL